ncbi:cytochrome b [Trichonephila clavipes]|uniref:Cytochrome b n=1 Tax=Trichonephila clavipes TaxID=2585209 RepID=A0A8X6W7C5_TRICX|nr:cytochrome b [Trichonephila clavipes]
MSAYEPNSRHLREVLIFCFNMKKSAAEVHRMLSNTYGEAAISERTCREWFQRFKNGDFDPLSGRVDITTVLTTDIRASLRTQDDMVRWRFKARDLGGILDHKSRVTLHVVVIEVGNWQGNFADLTKGRSKAESEAAHRAAETPEQSQARRLQHATYMASKRDTETIEAAKSRKRAVAERAQQRRLIFIKKMGVFDKSAFEYDETLDYESHKLKK